MAIYNREDPRTVLPQLEKRIAGLIDLFYPVGSYYETSDSKFNPNTAWGGTWELEEEGQVHIGAGADYEIGDTGGEESHTLTVSEMPSHKHTITSYYSATVFYDSGSASRAIAEASSTGSTNNWSDASNTGGGGAHNNMQPYVVVNRWHRIK